MLTEFTERALRGHNDNHSNVHVWYHGTIDLRTPATYFDSISKKNITITTAMRQTWWSTGESRGQFAGFHHSRLGGGDRLSESTPDGAARIRNGFNQLWDLGAGQNANRTRLDSNSGDWPNVMRFNLTGTNLVAFGQTIPTKLYYQWARPAVTSMTVSVYLDEDLNPFNGNSRLLLEGNATSTGSDSIRIPTVELPVTAQNATVGWHAVYAKITGGGRTRYLYAPEYVQVIPSFDPPDVDITSVTAGGAQVRVSGQAGQVVVLETSGDLVSWQPFVTNRLESAQWTVTDSKATIAPARYYRSRLDR